jgi:RNA-binding protein
MSLTGKQKNYLRGLGHKLTALVQVGKAGVTPQVLEDIRTKIAHHELIKVKIDCSDQDDLNQLVSELGEDLKVEIVQVIGHTLILYAPAEGESKIPLPS